MNKNDKDLLAGVFVKLFFSMIPSSKGRTKFIRKHKLFDKIGSDVLWQPHELPSDPKCIRIHNNVKIAADVQFITHDVFYAMFQNMEEGRWCQNLACIEVMDNVCIGRNALILPGVRIGPNAIIAAGSVVTKDVSEGTVVGGNPAKVIGSFNAIMQKQKKASEKVLVDDRFDNRRIEQAWQEFENGHR